MSQEHSKPITIHEQDQLRAWAQTLIGRRVVGVRYRSAPGSNWPDGNSADTIHEVDMDITIMLDDGTSAVVSWAMDGLVEGIDLRIRRNSGRMLEIDETDVTATPEWRGLVDQVIKEVAAAWHVPNEGCPDTLWAVRLSLSEGSTIAFALGEVETDIVQYQPDALIVLFDETAARAYQPPASAETAFGTAIKP
jgi:hypothetical protein